MSVSTSTGAAGTVAADTARERLLTPAFVRLGVADLAYFLAEGVAIYALPLHVTGPVGSDEAGAGLAFGAFAVSAVVLRPLAGRWCDTHGRRPFLVLGAVLAAVALVATPLAADLATVVLLRLLLGAGEALFFVASLAALADLAPPSRTGEAVSYNSLALYLGLGLGAPLGELLVRHLGLPGAWLGAALLTAAAAATAASLRETRPDRVAGGPPVALVHRPALPMALGFLTSVVAMGGLLSLAPLHAGDVGLPNASLPLFTYGMVVVLLRIGLATVQDRLPPPLVGAVALATMSGGLLLLAVRPDPSGLVTGAAVVGIGVALSTPAFFAAIFATADGSSRGAAAGTASLALDLGLGLGPMALGWVARDGGIPTAFLVAAAVALAGTLWTLVVARFPGQAVDRTAERRGHGLR